MTRASTLGKIEKEIERLSPKDQVKLAEKLAHQLRKSGITVKKEIDWKGLYGLGKLVGSRPLTLDKMLSGITHSSACLPQAGMVYSHR